MRWTHRQPLLWLAVCVAMSCTTGTPTDTEGVEAYGRYLLHYEGPDLELALSVHHVVRQLGEEWLVVGVALTGPISGRGIEIARSDISMRTPDGRRLPLVEQHEFAKSYGELRASLRRAEITMPSLASPVEPDFAGYEGSLCRCWFLVAPGLGMPCDSLSVSSHRSCNGPLVFSVPGGVQPGRWKLVIDLEESRVEIPFEVEVE